LGLRIGIDTGGTFTDVVAFDTTRETLRFFKVHSTPKDPGVAVIGGAVGGADRSAVPVSDISMVVHGTTVGTNAILQRDGARVALVTTVGFRDVLHIQRQSRPRLYDMRFRRAEPLVPRRLRFEIKERMRFDGTVEQTPDLDDLARCVVRLSEEDVEAVAVCLLHSDINPAHEQFVGEFLAARLKGVSVCLSHALACDQGEYERFSTCVLNAFMQPVMQRYLGGLSEGLRREAIASPVLVMKSNGGVAAAERVSEQCVQTVLSGPAGAVVAGAAIAAEHTNRNLITADMGGTSFDVAVIDEGRVPYNRQAEIAGLAIQIPMLDLHTVGAGGGSIGWLDAGGALRVGPRSAGAVPGPACYGRGGEQPTVTDANLVLGRLRPDSTLAGGMPLDLEAARRALHDHLAAPTGLSIEAMAEGILRVVNTTMVAAIRRLTVERGLDARRFTLCAFGGAGPLHGADLAREMGIDEILIPLAPGVTSALGLLMSNLREDRVRTHVERLDDALPEQIDALFEEMACEARKALVVTTSVCKGRRLGLRYVGQRYDLPVEVAAGYPDLVRVAEDFHAAHERRFGFARREEPMEIVNLWVSESIDIRHVTLPEVPVGPASPSPQATRTVVFDGRGRETGVYRREALGAASAFRGPAIVEQDDTTVVVLPGQHATVDRFGHLVLRAAAAKEGV